MNKKLINKIARKIILAKTKASCRQCLEECYDIDSLIINDVQMINNNNKNEDDFVYVYIDVEAKADTYEQPYDYYGPPPGTYIKESTIQVENYYDLIVEIYHQNKKMKLNPNDKIIIKFDGNEYKGNFNKIENDIIQHYLQQITFQSEWEFYDDEY